MLKKTMLAAAMAALALAALPGVAWGDPEMELGGFTVHGEETKFTTTGGTTVICETAAGNGKFENSATGSIALIFHGCKETGFGIKCKSPEQESGTIETTELTFHLKTVTGKKTPAILLTPSEPNSETHIGHFTTFNCSFLAHMEVTGTGFIGEITEKYNEELSSWNVSFTSSEAGHQTHTAVDGDETDWDLRTSINETEAETASLDSEVALTPVGVVLT